jgi:glycosyltransferase involved in cell wall biosynthesis
MKILIVNTLYAPFKIGGAEKSVQILAEGLSQSGEEVSVLTLRESCNQKKFEVLNRVNIHRVTISNIFWPFSGKNYSSILKFVWHIIDMFNVIMLFKMIYKIWTINPDIVHTNNIQGFSSSIWVACWLLRKPIVHTMRDYYLFCPKTTMFQDNKVCEKSCIACSCLSAPKKITSNLVSAHIGISDFILDKHVESNYFDRKCGQSETIYNIASNLVESNCKIKPVQIKKIGFIGRLDPSKGIEKFLQLAEALVPNGQFVFYIAGTGSADYVATLKSRFQHPCINFLGRQDPDMFFNEIDLLLVPSLWNEPFGRVVAESIEYGVPVLVSDRGGLSELVDDTYVIALDGNFEQQFLNKIEDILVNGYVVRTLKSSSSYLNVYSKLVK